MIERVSGRSRDLTLLCRGRTYQLVDVHACVCSGLETCVAVLLCMVRAAGRDGVRLRSGPPVSRQCEVLGRHAPRKSSGF